MSDNNTLAMSAVIVTPDRYETIRKTVRHSGRSLKLLERNLPVVTLGLVVNVFGEMTGYTLVWATRASR